MRTHPGGCHCGRVSECNCFVASFYVPRSDPDKIDVNARCLDGIDLASLRVRQFDGRNWEASIETFER